MHSFVTVFSLVSLCCVSVSHAANRRLSMHDVRTLRNQRELREQIQCPDEGGFTGLDEYIGKGPKAAPLRGAVGCVDSPKWVKNPQTEGMQAASLIYGPFEGGFSFEDLEKFFDCTNEDAVLPPGLDTEFAETLAAYLCDTTVEVLGACGGHGVPYHYHQRMSCLYTQDSVTGHSTRVGTALDGRGIYGKYIDGGVVPTDLDACNMRYGVTPDSNGEQVWYYVVTDEPPFTVGCFGPVSSVEECKALYPTCGDGEVDVETKDGTVKYDLDCPCFDRNDGKEESGPGQVKRPNIILFQPDDVSPGMYEDDGSTDLGHVPSCPALNDVPATGLLPRLDSLRRDGATFKNFYTASGACAPSRFAVLTGRFPARSKSAIDMSDDGFAEVVVPRVRMVEDDLVHNLPRALQKLGYKTGMVGKWHLTERNVVGAGYSDPYEAQQDYVKRAGFNYVDGLYVENLEDSLGFSHNQEWVTLKALEFMKETIQAGDPFFLYMNPTLIHTPDIKVALEASDRKTPYRDLDQSPDITAVCTSCQMLSRPEIWQKAASSGITDDESMIKRHAGLIWIDESIGALLDFLAEKEVLDDTVILYFGENGNAKNSVYEQGIHNVLYARYKKGNFHGEYDHLVSGYDIAPTVLELAGMDTEKSLYDSNGISFARLAAGFRSTDHEDRTLFLQSSFDVALISQARDELDNLENTIKIVSQGQDAKLNDQVGSRVARCYPLWGQETQVYDFSEGNTEQAMATEADAIKTRFLARLTEYKSNVTNNHAAGHEMFIASLSNGSNLRKKWQWLCDCDMTDYQKCLDECKENRKGWEWTCEMETKQSVYQGSSQAQDIIDLHCPARL